MDKTKILFGVTMWALCVFATFCIAVGVLEEVNGEPKIVFGLCLELLSMCGIIYFGNKISDI